MHDYLSSSHLANVAHSELYLRVTALLEQLSTEAESLPAPHCPAWTVKDVLAHVVGVHEDVLNGNMDGAATTGWTEQQVNRHSSDSVNDLLLHWSVIMTDFKAVLVNIPPQMISLFIFDQVTHEHDIRAAISQPGAKDSSAVHVAQGFLRNALAHNNDPEIAQLAEIEIDAFDFVRSLSGRRSRQQIANCGINPDLVERFLIQMPFDIPDRDITE